MTVGVDPRAVTGSPTDESEPNRRGLLDRLVGLPQTLPGPALAWCAVFFLVLLVVPHLIVWFAGGLPIGEVTSYIWLPAVVSGAVVALVTILDATARRAFVEFEPALGSRPDAAQLARQLTSIPDGVGFAVIAAVVVVATIGYLTDAETYAFMSSRSIVEMWTVLIVSWISIALAGLLIVHTVIQLSAVSRLHRAAAAVDLFNPAPAHAFARVTALTGVAFLVLGVLVLGDPTAGRGTAFYALEGLLVIGFAAAAFGLPLRGMHSRLSAQKSRLMHASDERIKVTATQIHDAVDTDDLERSPQLHATLASLIAERDLVSRLSTWPWSTATIRTFGSALLLPIVIWLVTRFLERAGI